jgi:hypothetical protein
MTSEPLPASDHEAPTKSQFSLERAKEWGRAALTVVGIICYWFPVRNDPVPERLQFRVEAPPSAVTSDRLLGRMDVVLKDTSINPPEPVD